MMGNERGGGVMKRRMASHTMFIWNDELYKKLNCSEYTVGGGRERECFSLLLCVFSQSGCVLKIMHVREIHRR